MIHKDRRPIRTLAEWERMAGPKSPDHWKDGRSAKEAARLWLAQSPGTLPGEVSHLLANHPDFGLPRSWTAEPEKRVRIDSFRGEQPNVDLLLHAVDSFGRFVVVVEAKADEPFAATLGQRMASARAVLTTNPRSKAVARIETLLERVLGVGPEHWNDVVALRYQLLTATGAAIASARANHDERALVLVQEFVTDRTTDAKHDANHRDLNAFVGRLGLGAVEVGSIVGPVRRDGVRVYFGKVRHNQREERT